MRKSIVAIIALTSPLLAVVACGPAHHTPPRNTVVKGIVSEKEYEPAKRTCKAPKTPRTSKKRSVKPRPVCTYKMECYELDIKLDGTGKEMEICNRAAFNALAEGDRYSSAIDYSTVGKL